MEKINFQNGITPLNDTNLNQLQDNMEEAGVVVSPTEPTTNEKVWIQKGKNLYNPKKAYVSGNLSQNISLIYRNVKAGKTYTFSATNYSWITIKTYNSSNELIREVGSTEFTKDVTITIQDTETYVELIFYSGLTNLTSTSGIDFTGVQLEKSSTVTEYEPYVERKIKVDGEEFLNVEKANNQQNYSTSEQVIGTWIDGKPLYRKTIRNSFVDDWTTLYLNDINADTIYINYGKTFANFKINNTYYSNGQFYISETDFFRIFIANKNELLVAFASGMTEREATITIEYTKTTD